MQYIGLIIGVPKSWLVGPKPPRTGPDCKVEFPVNYCFKLCASFFQGFFDDYPHSVDAWSKSRSNLFDVRSRRTRFCRIEFTHLYDFQVCTEIVLPGGTNNVTDMFPPLPFTLEMRTNYCEKHLGVTPRNHWLSINVSLIWSLHNQQYFEIVCFTFPWWS